MTYFPDYLKSYPNMNTEYPLHISLNRLPAGFRPHRHDFLEFSYVVEGHGAETVNGMRHLMSPGTFTFVLPYQVHELFTSPGSELVLYNCMFSMDLLMENSRQEGLLRLIDSVDDSPYIQLNGEVGLRMKRLIEDMFAEYNGSEPWKHTMLRIKLKEILVAFDRSRKKAGGRNDAERETASAASGARSGSVWPIIHYIHHNYHEDITLSALAARFSMSASRISEVIKATTGQTFVRFLHDLRVRHACSLLASTEMSVSEIALEVGYGSYATFARVFRDSKGMVPNAYRKKHVQAD